MMEAVRTSETSVDNHFTRQYIPEDNSEQSMGVFFIRAVSDTMFGIPFLPKPPRTTWRTAADHSLINDVVEHCLRTVHLYCAINFLKSVSKGVSARQNSG
jgi:hypothetical protein